MDDTGERILGSALEVFFRYGLRRTTMEDIAREAGVSRQTLYDRFGNKESLFSAAAAHLFERSMSRLRDGLPGEGDVWERILLALDQAGVPSVRALQRSDHSAELWAAQSTVLAAVVEAKHREMIDALAGALSEASEAGEIDLGDTAPRQLAEMLVTADLGFKSEGVSVRRYRARLRTSIDMLRKATRV